MQRVEDNGLALPTLRTQRPSPVFDRMVDTDNIPLRMGLNRELSVTTRFQRLDSALDPIHKLTVLYSVETQKGKPYARELAVKLLVYEAKVSRRCWNWSEPYLATHANDKRYQVHVDYLEQVRTSARQFYANLVYGATDADRYSKSDSLTMIKELLAAPQHVLRSDPHRSGQAGLTQKLTQQISETTDQHLKKALTELRDTIQHRSRIPP